jgi:hypothetical protein
MTEHQAAELKTAFVRVFEEAINKIGLDAFKRTSWFGSNDPAYLASKMKKVA